MHEPSQTRELFDPLLGHKHDAHEHLDQSIDSNNSKELAASRGRILSRIASLAGPLAIQNVFGYSLSIIAAVSVGRMNDEVVLSAVVLAGSLYNVTGLSLIVGLAAGCDTIAGQAFGAGNYRMVGETLLRAILICLTCSLPVLGLWSQAVPVMTLLKQSPEIVAAAARYLRLVSPSLLLSAFSNPINRCLLAQRVVKPGPVCTAITAALCPLYNWLFIYKWGLGLDGAAYAFLASNATYTCLMIGVVLVRAVALRGSPLQTWPGITTRLFSGWPQYLSYGLPAAAMICCEWWVFELVILMAGSLPSARLSVAVMGITFHITCVAFMLPASVGSAVNTCIANELGAGHDALAVTFFKTGLAVVLCIQACITAFLTVFRNHIGSWFTGAQDVVDLTGRTMPMVALCIVFDGINSLLSGVLRGCGRQAWGAGLNLIGYWLVGFPLALYLGFKLDMETQGFWTALAVASSLQACIQVCFITFCINWKQEVLRAAALVSDAFMNGRRSMDSLYDDPSPHSSTSNGQDAVLTIAGIYEKALRDSAEMLKNSDDSNHSCGSSQDDGATHVYIPGGVYHHRAFSHESVDVPHTFMDESSTLMVLGPHTPPEEGNLAAAAANEYASELPEQQAQRAVTLEDMVEMASPDRASYAADHEVGASGAAGSASTGDEVQQQLGLTAYLLSKTLSSPTRTKQQQQQKGGRSTQGSPTTGSGAQQQQQHVDGADGNAGASVDLVRVASHALQIRSESQSSTPYTTTPLLGTTPVRDTPLTVKGEDPIPVRPELVVHAAAQSGAADDRTVRTSSDTSTLAGSIRGMQLPVRSSFSSAARRSRSISDARRMSSQFVIPEHSVPRTSPWFQTGVDCHVGGVMLSGQQAIQEVAFSPPSSARSSFGFQMNPNRLSGIQEMLNETSGTGRLSFGFQMNPNRLSGIQDMLNESAGSGRSSFGFQISNTRLKGIQEMLEETSAPQRRKLAKSKR